MRVFESVKELHSEIKRDLAEMGITYTSNSVQDIKKELVTTELMNYSYVVPNVVDFISMYHIAEILDTTRDDPRLLWAEAEISERINYKDPSIFNPGKAYLKNLEFWDPYKKKGRFSYTYAERLHPQYLDVITELQTNPSTRQAILEMYNSEWDMQNWGGKARVPCTMHYQFFIRNNKIHMNHIMRSCDFERFFLFDLFFAIYLLHDIRLEVDRELQIGCFTQFIGSLHCFPKNLEGVF